MYRGVISNIYKDISYIMRDSTEHLECAETLENANLLESTSNDLIDFCSKAIDLIQLVKNLSDEYRQKAREIRIRESENDDKKMLFVSRNGGYYSWADLVEKDDSRKKIIEKTTVVERNLSFDSNLLYQNINSIRGANIGNINLPVAHKLKDIPPALYWYNGGKKSKPGIYIKITDGFVAEVPFSSVKDGRYSENVLRTVRCKYVRKEECQQHKQQIARKLNLEVKKCEYVHQGEKIERIGYTSRCLDIPGFGDYNHIIDDVYKVSERDLRTMLLNSLNDILLASVWYQNVHTRNYNNRLSGSKKIIFSDLDTFK
jgi:hypothetical protein